MVAQPLDAAEWRRTAEFFAVTLRHIGQLRREQRHDAAARSLDGLQRLAATIRREQASLGYFAELVLGDMLAAIEIECDDGRACMTLAIIS